MPRLNSRGPNGEGPMTGRKMGRCKSDEKLPAAEPEQGVGAVNRRGAGMGKGKGMGKGLGKGKGRGMGNGMGRGGN